MTERAGEDRRKHTRTELVLKVEYQEPWDLLADYLTDLGEGGLFICTTAAFEIGQRIGFAVSFPGLLEPIALEGIVRWRQERGAKRPNDEPGVGVEFVYPSEQHRRDVTDLLARLQMPIAPRNGVSPFRVLLVEDNKFAHKLFHHAIKKFHHEIKAPNLLQVSNADSGGEALKLLKEAQFDLAIVDHFLPVMTGAEIIRRMRKDPTHKDTPILVISVGGEGVREEVVAAGADLYLDKPVMLRQLLNTLRILLTNRSPEQAQDTSLT